MMELYIAMMSFVNFVALIILHLKVNKLNERVGRRQ